MKHFYLAAILTLISTSSFANAALTSFAKTPEQCHAEAEATCQTMKSLDFQACVVHYEVECMASSK